MKSFDTFINDAESLNERSFQSLLKTGSVLTAARASKRYGDAAVKELQKVSSTLDKPIPNNATVWGHHYLRRFLNENVRLVKCQNSSK